MFTMFRVAAFRLAMILGLTAVLPSASFGAMSELEQAARKEGQVTWYISQYGAEVASNIARAFEKQYPGIKVNVVRATAQVTYQRLIQDIRANVAQCDVFGITDVGAYVDLRGQNRLAKYSAESAAMIAPEFRAAIEKNGYWYPTSALTIAIAYNTNKIKPADAPKKWADLVDPKWRGTVALPHPGYSGVAGVWGLMVSKLYGREYIEKLEKNRPLVGRSILDTVTMLNSGERSVAVSLVGPALESASKGNPIAVVYPEEGSVIVDAPTAILQNAPHPNAARLFMEFLLGIEHAKLVVSLPRYESVRAEVKPLPGGKPLHDLKLLRASDEEVTQGIPKLIERWRDLFGN